MSCTLLRVFGWLVGIEPDAVLDTEVEVVHAGDADPRLEAPRMAPDTDEAGSMPSARGKHGSLDQSQTPDGLAAEDRDAEALPV
jgi:hypothetical protein